jgi:hypothetical protein
MAATVAMGSLVVLAAPAGLAVAAPPSSRSRQRSRQTLGLGLVSRRGFYVDRLVGTPGRLSAGRV